MFLPLFVKFQASKHKESKWKAGTYRKVTIVNDLVQYKSDFAADAACIMSAPFFWGHNHQITPAQGKAEVSVRLLLTDNCLQWPLDRDAVSRFNGSRGPGRMSAALVYRWVIGSTLRSESSLEPRGTLPWLMSLSALHHNVVIVLLGRCPWRLREPCAAATCR